MENISTTENRITTDSDRSGTTQDSVTLRGMITTRLSQDSRGVENPGFPWWLTDKFVWILAGSGAAVLLILVLAILAARGKCYSCRTSENERKKEREEKAEVAAEDHNNPAAKKGRKASKDSRKGSAVSISGPWMSRPVSTFTVTAIVPSFLPKCPDGSVDPQEKEYQPCVTNPWLRTSRDSRPWSCDAAELISQTEDDSSDESPVFTRKKEQYDTSSSAGAQQVAPPVAPLSRRSGKTSKVPAMDALPEDQILEISGASKEKTKLRRKISRKANWSIRGNDLRPKIMSSCEESSDSVQMWNEIVAAARQKSVKKKQSSVRTYSE